MPRDMANGRASIPAKLVSPDQRYDAADQCEPQRLHPAGFDRTLNQSWHFSWIGPGIPAATSPYPPCPTQRDVSASQLPGWLDFWLNGGLQGPMRDVALSGGAVLWLEQDVIQEIAGDYAEDCTEFFEKYWKVFASAAGVVAVAVGSSAAVLGPSAALGLLSGILALLGIAGVLVGLEDAAMHFLAFLRLASEAKNRPEQRAKATKELGKTFFSLSLAVAAAEASLGPRGVAGKTSSPARRPEKHLTAPPKPPPEREIRIQRNRLAVVADDNPGTRWNGSINATLPDGTQHAVCEWSIAVDNGQPSGGLRLWVDGETAMGGRPVKIRIYQRGARQSLTDVVLDEVLRKFQRQFGQLPGSLSSRLGFDNKLHFQREFLLATRSGHGEQAAAQVAIRRISYGRSRQDRGYGDFEVQVSGQEAVDLGEPLGVQTVPASITVVARRAELPKP